MPKHLFARNHSQFPERVCTVGFCCDLLLQSGGASLHAWPLVVVWCAPQPQTLGFPTHMVWCWLQYLLVALCPCCLVCVGPVHIVALCPCSLVVLCCSLVCVLVALCV